MRHKSRKRTMIISVIIVIICMFIITVLFLFTDIFINPEFIFIKDYNKNCEGITRTENVKRVDLKDDLINKYTLHMLRYCPELKEIYYYKRSKIDDLDFLQGHELSVISIKGTCDDWTPISQCTSLEFIGIYESDFSDISLLRNFTKLNQLCIQTDRKLNYDGIETLSSLKLLEINSPSIDAEQIKNTENLTSLILWCDELINPDKLVQLDNVADLSIRGLNIDPGDISDLSQMRNLKMLNFKNSSFAGSEEEVRLVTDKLQKNGIEISLGNVKYNN